MKRTLSILGIGWLLAGAVAAQDEASPDPKPDAQARYNELQQEIRKAQSDYRAELRKQIADAQANGTAMPAMRMSPDMAPFIGKFEAAAAEFSGTDDAAMFLVWVVQNGSSDDEALDRAVASLVAHHGNSGHLAALARMSGNLERMVGPARAETLGAAMAVSENPAVIGWLAFVENGDTIKEADTESKAYQEAKALLMEIAEGNSDPRLSREIVTAIDLREKFGIGATAPDIVGVDLDGASFKLSDYSGKVVFLDFWGDW